MEDFDFSVFEEPKDFRPPTPPPSERIHRRDGKEIRYQLVGQHSLWAHVAWNAGIWMANYIDRNPGMVQGKCILELGAGAALPSMISALQGAQLVVATDYPDLELIETLQRNIAKNCGDLPIQGRGFLWGSERLEPLLELLPEGKKQGFDLIFLCDLVFNHTQHENMLKTCMECLTTGKHAEIWCAFTHHRPWLADRDDAFLDIAQQAPYNFRVEKMFEDKMDVMFEKDPGSVDVRQTVHVYRLTSTMDIVRGR